MKESLINPDLRDLFSGPDETGYADFLGEFLKPVEKGPNESRGFRYIPPDNIIIIPAGRDKGVSGGIIEIREPDESYGTDEFKDRDAYEKEYPIKRVKDISDYENQVFEGEKCPEPFNPEFGGRVCLTLVKLYESKEGEFMSMPIIPPTGQNFEGGMKFSGSSLIGSARYPNTKEVLRKALGKEVSNLSKKQEQHPDEKLLSQSQEINTGLWSLKLVDKKGKYGQVNGCHVKRDEQTGTLEFFKAQKQYVFEDIDDLIPSENLPSDMKRINTLVNVEDLKNAKEGQPLKLKGIFWEGKKVINFSDLPEIYKDVFEQKDGDFYVTEYKPTPPVQAYLENESRIVQPAEDNRENDVRVKIGELFEKLVGKTLEVEKNEKELSLVIPSNNELTKILDGQPEDFKNWVLDFVKKNITVNVKPDFILSDGAFLEVKSGGKVELKPEKRAQLFRMALYKLIKGESLNSIKFFTLMGESEDSGIFPEIKYEKFLDSEWKDNMDPGDLKKIKFWQQEL